MPIFGDNDEQLAAGSESLGPITQQRLETALDALEVNYGHDDDGDVIAGFDGNPCWFRLSGPGEEEIAFTFNGRWKAWLPSERWLEALELANEWNASRMFPRALCVRDDDGDVILGVDYVVDYEFGVTDQQLRNDISIAITTTVDFFEQQDAAFPEAVQEAEQAIRDMADEG